MVNLKDIGLLCAAESTHINDTLHYEAPVNLTNFNRFFGHCSVGAFTYINPSGQFTHTSIGRYCSIAESVICGPGQHNPNYFSNHPFVADPDDASTGLKCFNSYARILGRSSRPPAVMPRSVQRRDVTIGHDVWVGTRVIIMSGVRIGHGAVVGAGAVVTKDVDPYTIVGGVPARPIRRRFSDSMIADLLALEWWNFDLSGVTNQVDYGRPQQVIDHLRSRLRAGTLSPLRTVTVAIKKTATGITVSDATRK